MADGEWLGYADAAARLGMTPDAVRQRVKRGQLKAARANNGHPVVWVSAVTDEPDKPVVTNRTVTTEQIGQTDRPDAAPDRLTQVYASLEQELRRRAESAEARVERAEEQVAEARRDAREARQRADALSDRLPALERAAGAAEARHAADAATITALKAELAQARRPWWRLLSGR